jgi:hypothetical protein
LQEGIVPSDGLIVKQRVDSSKDIKNEVGGDDDDDDDDEPANVDSQSPHRLIQPKEDDYMEDWMKQRIRRVVNSLESMKVKMLKKERGFFFHGCK